MCRAASLLLRFGARARGGRRGPGRGGLSTALPVSRWFWLRGSRAVALDSERLSLPPCGAGRWGRRGQSAPSGSRGAPVSGELPPPRSVEAGCSCWSFATPKRPGSAAPVPRLALARRPARAPPSHRRLGNSLGFSCKCILSLCRGSFKLSFQTVN